MERGRWFRRDQNERERPFDWLALARDFGIAAHQARELLDEAVRRARLHPESHRRELAIYVDLLRAARKQVRRSSPGKVTLAMRLDDPGAQWELRVSRLTGEPIAPGRRTLTTFLVSEQERL